MLTVQERDTSVSTKKLRKSGVVPVVYFHKHEASKSLQVKTSDLVKVLASQDSVHELSNGTMAVVKEVQRDPVSQKLLHVSFQGVVKGEKFQQEIPVQITHKEKTVWMAEGLQLRQLVSSVTVETTPKNLPEHLTHDVSDLKEGDTVTIADLVKPKGVEVMDSADEVVAMLAHAKVESDESEVSEEEAPVEESEPTTEETKEE